MAVSAQHNVYVVEELIQLTVESDAEILLRRTFFLKYSRKAAVSVFKIVDASAPLRSTDRMGGL